MTKVFGLNFFCELRTKFQKMINLGNYNTLEIVKMLDFGAYLTDGTEEILLPKRYVTEEMQIGDEVKVFVYKDSEDRPVATTETPKALVGDFAFMKVKSVNNTGAFMDWGLIAKELLVPFREQKVKMQEGRYYVVYVYLDDASQRIVASAKLDKFLDNTLPHYQPNDKAQILVSGRTDLGFKVIVDNLFSGMIYHNQIFTDVNVGERHSAIVRQVRPDGKIDLQLGLLPKQRVGDLSTKILNYLRSNNGSMEVHDGSSPEVIRAIFACSKKDFKKALGHLFKDHKVEILPNGVRLVEKP